MQPALQRVNVERQTERRRLEVHDMSRAWLVIRSPIDASMGPARFGSMPVTSATSTLVLHVASPTSHAEVIRTNTLLAAGLYRHNVHLDLMHGKSSVPLPVSQISWS